MSAEHSFPRRLFVSGLLSLIPACAWAQNFPTDALKGLLNRNTPGNSPGAASGQVIGAGLTQNEIGLGLKEALKQASQRVVGRLGKADGYNADPAIRIPLPESLQKVESALKSVGGTGMLDDLRLKMNRAAEQAAPKALNILVDAGSKLSFDDARAILTGPKDAATQYFQRTTSGALRGSFRPVVDSSLSGVGAVSALNAVQAKARGIPFVGQSVGGFDFTDFTVEKALDGMLHYLAVEETAIRTNPVERTTTLLKRVFG